jgi:putative transposase
MSIPLHRTAPGSSYFVTTKCAQGRTLFQVTELASIMLETIFAYRDSGAYLLHEFVIMPDHLHLLLTPNRQTSLEKAIQLIKGGSSHRIRALRGSKIEIWQKGFYDWTIRDAEDWRIKAEYIRQNPVRALLAAKAADWERSSANEKFVLDTMPERFFSLASGAKAPFLAAATPGLKPRPPKEKTVPVDKNCLQKERNAQAPKMRASRQGPTTA